MRSRNSLSFQTEARTGLTKSILRAPNRSCSTDVAHCRNFHAACFFFERFVPVRNFYYPGHAHHQGDSYTSRFLHDQLASWLFRRMGAGDVLTPGAIVAHAPRAARCPRFRKGYAGSHPRPALRRALPVERRAAAHPRRRPD